MTPEQALVKLGAFRVRRRLAAGLRARVLDDNATVVEGSCESLAKWLGVGVRTMHDALGLMIAYGALRRKSAGSAPTTFWFDTDRTRALVEAIEVK